MSFRVAARTILELGAELISSDAVAIYELVKNAIDAQSDDGVSIDFHILLPHRYLVDARERLKATRLSQKELMEIKQGLIDHIVPDAASEELASAKRSILAAVSSADLLDTLRDLDDSKNYIEIRDTGTGMSNKDLLDAYLVIGTPSRRAVLEKTSPQSPAPFLGEKGVGRLSAMRLGDLLHVKTSTSADKFFNVLDVDWSAFANINAMLEDITVVPTRGDRKSGADGSGTLIRIGRLQADWSPQRLRQIVSGDLARLSNPFAKRKRRYRIVIRYNGERVDIPRFDHELLKLAQARVTGKYEIVDGNPCLHLEMWCGDLGKGNPSATRTLTLERADLRSITKLAESEIPASALTKVGAFSFDLHWFNRRLIKGVDGFADRKRLLELHDQWSGIMLFRDGYRVHPYGNKEDDWLDLDRRALASGGYKLNKQQFIGHVAITRLGNPELIDQTNREGLKDCDAKQVLVEVLRFAIQSRLREFLKEIERAHSATPEDLEDANRRVNNLDTRIRRAVRELGTRHNEERPQLAQLLAYFDEMQDYFDQAKRRAEAVEDERDRMIQLAGVGLMLEVVAHELARSTEQALKLLNEAKSERLPSDVASLFDSMRDEMKSMNRRLRVLDPLSVSGRQRKETFDLVELVRDIFNGHQSQFKRHHIEATVKASGPVHVHGVRGMYVQIVENLINNSVYWLGIRRDDESGFRPKIVAHIAKAPELLRFSDNGPGILPDMREEVFKAFYSTKGRSRRQGLGLYIARDCAQHNGADLYLSDDRTEHRQRLNTFILELPSP